MATAPKIIAIVTDLMFIAKVQDGAKRAGFETIFARGASDAIGKAKDPPAVIVIDLNGAGIDVLGTIRDLKGAAETRDTPVLGFVSHVAADLIKAAQEQGCDRVVARSAFSQNLPALLAGYAKTEPAS